MLGHELRNPLGPIVGGVVRFLGRLLRVEDAAGPAIGLAASDMRCTATESVNSVNKQQPQVDSERG
jgi:hypothetical protein